MKLHYSQTKSSNETGSPSFQYLMKLHYSQTKQGKRMKIIEFQYLMKLHYSQTDVSTPSSGTTEYYMFESSVIS